MLVDYLCEDIPLAFLALKYTVSLLAKISGFLKPLFAFVICLALLSSLLCFTSELSMILWGMVGRPGNRGARLRNNSAGLLLLSGHCSQFRVWQTDVMPVGVPSECAIAAFTLFTAFSSSPLDWGEYAEDNSWFIPADEAHFLIALLVRPNCGPPSVVSIRDKRSTIHIKRHQLSHLSLLAMYNS